MQFLFIISHDDAFTPSETLFADIAAWIADTVKRGIRIHGNPLRPANDAQTVRVRNGKIRITAGPFEDSVEKMCAYELVECASLDEATKIASSHPMAKVATIEVRPVWQELIS
ncbi:MAG: transcription initiation protein [Desulfobulbaceae bacterium]|nr:transcription initiation protein [Desulfobulbaceae bacterium]